MLAVFAVLAMAALPSTEAVFSGTTATAGDLQASTGCPAPGVDTVWSVADAEVRSDEPTVAFGSGVEVLVRAGDLMRRRALVRFDLPSSPSAWCSVTSATLRIRATSAAAGRTLQVHRAATAWNESTVTWNTQPAVVGSPATQASAVGWVEWDVTAHVASMLAGANHGFVVRDADETGLLPQDQVLSSRESSDDPELVVIWG